MIRTSGDLGVIHFELIMTQGNDLETKIHIEDQLPRRSTPGGWEKWIKEGRVGRVQESERRTGRAPGTGRGGSGARVEGRTPGRGGDGHGVQDAHFEPARGAGAHPDPHALATEGRGSRL